MLYSFNDVKDVQRLKVIIYLSLNDVTGPCVISVILNNNVAIAVSVGGFDNFPCVDTNKQV